MFLNKQISGTFETYEQCLSCKNTVTLLKIEHYFEIRGMLLFPFRKLYVRFCSQCHQEEKLTKKDILNIVFSSYKPFYKRYWGLFILPTALLGVILFEKFESKQIYESINNPEIGSYYVLYNRPDKTYLTFKVVNNENNDLHVQLSKYAYTASGKRINSKIKKAVCEDSKQKEKWEDNISIIPKDYLKVQTQEHPFRVTDHFNCD